MRRLFTVASVIALLAAGPVEAQPVSGQPTQGRGMNGHLMPGVAMQDPAAAMHGMTMTMGERVPAQPGQAAFGAVQEIIRILEADPSTDWSKVNLDAVREHLIDMDEVTLHADAAVQHIGGGIQVTVTGHGRTLEAIRRMVPADARHLNGHNGWVVRATDLPNGVTLFATSDEPKQTAIIRGLGFMGVLASGDYHQAHHLMIARGEQM